MKINQGTAAYARKMFVAKIRRTLKVVETLEAKVILQGLLVWLREQQERCDKKKGGIGKQ